MVALAVLNKGRSQAIFDTSFFGTPLTLYGDKSGLDILKDSNFVQLVKDAILFTLAYCESKFEMPLDYPKIENIMISLPKYVAGMENLGLTTLYEFYYDFQAHEVSPGVLTLPRISTKKK